MAAPRRVANGGQGQTLLARALEVVVCCALGLVRDHADLPNALSLEAPGRAAKTRVFASRSPPIEPATIRRGLPQLPINVDRGRHPRCCRYGFVAHIVGLALLIGACGKPTGAAPQPAHAADAGSAADAGRAGTAAAVDLSVGLGHTCVATAGGRVACWGDNDAGQLGDGTTVSRPYAVVVSGLAEVARVFVHAATTCAVTSTDQTWCWGKSVPSGLATQPYRPARMATARPVSAMVLSNDHLCALYRDGTMACLGEKGGNPGTFVAVPGVTGARHATLLSWEPTLCYTDADRLLRCKSLDDPAQATVQSSIAFEDFRGTWGYDFVGLDTAGDVWIHGYHRLSQPPIGCTAVKCLTATRLPGATGIARLSKNCGVRQDGTALCWALVPGTFTPNAFAKVAQATAVEPLRGAVQVDGWDPVCFRDVAGIVRCWGTPCCGGPGPEWQPAEVIGFSDAAQLVGTEAGYCATDTAGGHWCWGQFPAVHAEVSTAFAFLPQPFAGLPGVRQLTGTALALCGLNTSGGVLCRGWQTIVYGSTEHGSDCRDQPCALAEAGTAVALAVGGETAGGASALGARWCAVGAAGELRCWGNNQGNAADFGTYVVGHAEAVWPPIQASGMPPAKSVCTGADFGCAVVESGKVYCWGNASHWLGKGPAPEAIVLAAPATAVACSGSLACAVGTGGEAWCWGRIGWTGPATPTGPQSIAGLPPVSRIAVHGKNGYLHGCAVALDGRVFCWGQGHGPLGLGETVHATAVAMPLAGIANGRDIATGWGHGCASTTDGRVLCWGQNSTGETGNAPVPIAMPVTVSVPGP